MLSPHGTKTTMTGNSNKLRGLFLAALMVLSVFAMGATFSGTVAADHANDQPHDETVADGTTYWLGQTLLHNGQADSTYEVRDSDGTLVSQIQSDSAGHVVIDTELTGTGNFELTGPGINTAISFEVVEQSLKAEISPERANNAGTDTTTTVTLRSNRANYQVEVTSENLDQNDLHSIFSGSSVYAGQSPDGGILLNGSNKQTVTADFDGIATGDYNLSFDVVDSTASATGSVAARQPEEGDISFAETVMVNERGDKLLMTLEFSGDVNQGFVTLGDSNEVNYEVTATVQPNSDGMVTLVWDTSLSADGTHGGLVKAEKGSLVSTNVVDSVSDPVQTGEYPVSVQIDDSTGTETDIATAIVEERSTEGISTHTAPAGLSGSDAVAAMSDSENGNTIAVTQNVQDKLIVQFTASGLGGYVDSQADLDPGSGNGVSLIIQENGDSVDVNEDPKTLLPSNAGYYDYDAETDTYTLVFNVGSLVQEDDDIGDTYDVVFHVDSDTQEVTSEDETVAGQFNLVRGQASFDLQGEKLMVPAEDGATVTGTSTWAPGTQLSVQLRSVGGQSPFTQQNKSIVVSADGTWSGSFTLADKPDGQSFQASLRHSNAGTQHEVKGQIGELSASVSFSDQTAQDAGTLVIVDSVTLSEGGFIAIHDAQGNIVGVSSYLEAGSHSDVRVRLDEPVEDRVTLEAMAHKDTDGNMQFGFVATDGAEDGAYTSGGSPVTASATVGLSTPTPTPEPTPEPTATPEPTPEPTDTPSDDEETPGFGLVVALVALMAAALLAVRRDN